MQEIITKALVTGALIAIGKYAARKVLSSSAVTTIIKTCAKSVFKYILSCVNPLLSAAAAILAGFIAAGTIAAATIGGYVWATGKSVTIGW